MFRVFGFEVLRVWGSEFGGFKRGLFGVQVQLESYVVAFFERDPANCKCTPNPVSPFPAPPRWPGAN